MIWAKIASVFMFLGVVLGAFGSHALKSRLSDYSLDIYKTAVMYHFIHALGLFVVAWLSTTVADPKLNIAGIFMVFGIILFSGSLYALALTGNKALGAVTPFGGLAFLIAWTLLIFVRNYL